MTVKEVIAMGQYIYLSRLPKVPDDWREQFSELAEFEIKENEND